MAQAAAILGCAGPSLDREEAAYFAAAQPWGFILFARNVETPDQLHGLTHDLRAAVGRNAPILIDQEGGRVQRLRSPFWREWQPALDQMWIVAHAGSAAALRAMYLRSRLIAHELHAMGIDANCAPLADVARPGTHPILHNRLYGSTAETVAQAGASVAAGLLDGGVIPILKHMPGHGLATVDSHETLPRVAAERATLENVDFAAFRPLAHLPLGMTAHVVYDAIDPNLPGTLSPDVIALIRTQIGFDGLLMTDDISMGALRGPVGPRAADARAAGCDIILHCNGVRAEMDAVLAHCGVLSGPAAVRAQIALDARRPPHPLDIAQAEAEFTALTDSMHTVNESDGTPHA